MARLAEIVAIVRETGALEATRAAAAAEAQRAIDALAGLPRNRTPKVCYNWRLSCLSAAH